MTINETKALIKSTIEAACSDDDTCPVTGKRHAPDWSSVNVQVDGGTDYIDVNCKNCGRSGCLGPSLFLAEHINW